MSESDLERDRRVRELLEAWYVRAEFGTAADPEFLAGEDPEVVARFARAIEQCDGLLGAHERADAPIAEPETPSRLGPFTLLRTLGAGGSSRVYLAREEALGRLVALKVLEAGGHRDRVARARFRWEAEITAALEHPNVVHVYALGESDGRSYIAMQWLEGPTLDALPDPVSARQAARWGVELADALDAAHGLGVLHRDVKPSNVILHEQSVQLLDFGLARAVGGPALTEKSVVPGTIPYMSPEQVQGKGPLDPRTDVYSLGATLFELVSGEPPLGGGADPPVMIRRIVETDPRLLSVPRADRDFAVIVARCLEKDPRRRFPSAAAMRDDLTRFLDGRPIASRAAGPLTRSLKLLRRHRRFAWVAGALAAVVLAVTAVLLYRTWRSEEALRSDLLRVDRALADGRLFLAGSLLDSVADRHEHRHEVGARRRLLNARRALEDLLDVLFDLSALRAPDELRVLLETVESSVSELPSTTSGLAIALASIHCGDRPRARRMLRRLEKRGNHRPRLGESAVRHLLDPRTDGAPWDLAALPEGTSADVAVEEHLFAALACRLAERPFHQVAAHLEEARKRDPSHPRLRRARARHLRERREFREALAILEGLVEEGMYRPFTLYSLTRECLAVGDLRAARRWLARVPAGHRHILRDTVRADLARLSNDPAYADILRECLDDWPRDPDFLRLFGRLLLAQGRPGAAYEKFRQALPRAALRQDRERLEALCLLSKLEAGVRLGGLDTLGARLAALLQGKIRRACRRPRHDAGRWIDPLARELEVLIADARSPEARAVAHMVLARAELVRHRDPQARSHIDAAFQLTPHDPLVVEPLVRAPCDRVIGQLSGDAPWPFPQELQRDAARAAADLERHLEVYQGVPDADLLFMAAVLAAPQPTDVWLKRARQRYLSRIPHPMKARSDLLTRVLKLHPAALSAGR